jgi:hypothetical protein
LGRPDGTFENFLTGYDADIYEIVVILIAVGSLWGFGLSMTNKIATTIWAIEDVF